MLHSENRGYSRSSIARAALGIGLTHLEESGGLLPPAPARGKLIAIPCNRGTHERMHRLRAQNRGYARSSLGRTALLIGLAHLEKSEVRVTTDNFILGSEYLKKPVLDRTTNVHVTPETEGRIRALCKKDRGNTRTFLTSAHRH